MSWILKHKRRFIASLALLIFVAAFTAIYVNLQLNYIGLLVIYVILIALILLNEATRKKLQSFHKPFDTFSEIRNVDYLIIGDQCDPQEFVPEDKTYVQIAAPDRGIRSAYQILRHTHSILKEEGGAVIMTCGKSKKEFSIFDIPFLHPVTIKKYHLENLKMKSNLPILFAPIASLKFLIGGTQHTYTAMRDVDEELITFCEERNYSLKCFVKQ